jgi:DNA modification methylase
MTRTARKTPLKGKHKVAKKSPQQQTMEDFLARVIAETGASRTTLYRWIQTVRKLQERLGPGVVEKLVKDRAKITWDTELLEKLPTITSRDKVLEIIGTHKRDGSQAAMKAFDTAYKEQERQNIEARIAELTAGTVETKTELPWRNQILFGDALTELRKLPDNHLQCVVTSPPFFALRNYGTQTWFGGDPKCQHEEKIIQAPIPEAGDVPEHAEGTTHECLKCGAWRGEIGQEPTVDLYITHMVELFLELRRVLRKDGLIWVEIGDTYSGSGRGPTGRTGIGDQTKRQNFKSSGVTAPEIPGGNLLMVPARLALALQADGWILRAEICWNKTTGMPESVKDRAARNHSMIYMFAKAAGYYYDGNAVKQAAKGGTHTGHGPKMARPSSGNRNNASFMGGIHKKSVSVRNLRSVWGENTPEDTVWAMPTGMNRFAHTSTFPPWLPERCIRASMSPYGACAECGAPWRAKYFQPQVGSKANRARASRAGRASGSRRAFRGVENAVLPPPELLDWEPTCRCGRKDRIPQVGGDIFAGTGTTLAALKRLGHHYLGIELNRDNAPSIALSLALAEANQASAKAAKGKAKAAKAQARK